MDNPNSQRHRIIWLAVAVFGALLILPSTRSLLRSQLRLETLTFPAEANPEAEQIAAARFPNNYPVQLALAANLAFPRTEPFSTDVGKTDPSRLYSRRILALTERFPDNPSLYANLLRYMTLRDVHIVREEDGRFPGQPIPALAVNAAPQPAVSSPKALALFDSAALKGAQLDPENAYFPLMRSIGLFAAHRDAEAISALKRASVCTRWIDYYQDDSEGQIRLEHEAYGDRGVLNDVLAAEKLPLPELYQLRAAVRLAMYHVAEEEIAGKTVEAISIRHAVMRCGGLMRSQGSSFLPCVIGVFLTRIASKNPGGVASPQATSGKELSRAEQQKVITERWNRYFAYLERRGMPQEVTWANREMAAGEESLRLLEKSAPEVIFDEDYLCKLSWAWLLNMILLTTVLVTLVTGAAAFLPPHFTAKRHQLTLRLLYASLITALLVCWQWQVARLGSYATVTLHLRLSEATLAEQADLIFMTTLVTTVALLAVPYHMHGIVSCLCKSQKVPYATGIGRVLRGAALPISAFLFLLYGISLLYTAHLEKTYRNELQQTTHNESHYHASRAHKAWPGDPLP